MHSMQAPVVLLHSEHPPVAEQDWHLEEEFKKYPLSQVTHTELELQTKHPSIEAFHNEQLVVEVK